MINAFKQVQQATNSINNTMVGHNPYVNDLNDAMLELKDHVVINQTTIVDKVFVEYTDNPNVVEMVRGITPMICVPMNFDIEVDKIRFLEITEVATGTCGVVGYGTDIDTPVTDIVLFSSRVNAQAFVDKIEKLVIEFNRK